MIIIVDDRSVVSDALRTLFRREGIPSTGFASGEFQAWVAAADESDVRSVDAVIIGECEQPKAIASIIRRRGTAAVIAMKDQRSLASTLQLFCDGVDDVVFKPCHVREILARIEAIFRRARIEPTDRHVDHDIKTFRDGRPPLVGGRPLDLPRRELRILEFLAGNRNRRVTKNQIFSSVYGIFDADVGESVVESHISKLRRRLRARLGYDPIDSKRHLGYQLLVRQRREPTREAG